MNVVAINRVTEEISKLQKEIKRLDDLVMQALDGDTATVRLRINEYDREPDSDAFIFLVGGAKFKDDAASVVEHLHRNMQGQHRPVRDIKDEENGDTFECDLGDTLTSRVLSLIREEKNNELKELYKELKQYIS